MITAHAIFKRKADLISKYDLDSEIYRKGKIVSTYDIERRYDVSGETMELIEMRIKDMIKHLTKRLHVICNRYDSVSLEFKERDWEVEW
jgi:hypothetical protein